MQQGYFLHHDPVAQVAGVKRLGARVADLVPARLQLPILGLVVAVAARRGTCVVDDGGVVLVFDVGCGGVRGVRCDLLCFLGRKLPQVRARNVEVDMLRRVKLYRFVQDGAESTPCAGLGKNPKCTSSCESGRDRGSVV